eukprot:m.140465 g.140465  ORF g.140465 m.140465 type:complete len:678 (-) comp9627_c0_seq3:1838-3871(-)
MAERAKQWIRQLAGASGESVVDDPAEQIDARTVQRVTKTAKKIISYAKNPRLNLKNSPPYLQGIMMDDVEIITAIFRVNTIESLRTNEYFPHFLENFFLHCKCVLKLFKGGGVDMENETSRQRRKLSKLTLIFSHMLSELRALFKDGVWAPEYRIVKSEAREFWERAFPRRAIVPWAQFEAEFKKVQPLASDEEATLVRNTMNLTESAWISKFEFDIFTRLFQPWAGMLNTFNVIVVTHPGYVAYMTYDEVEATLSRWRNKPGSYVFRLSCTRLGQWAIGFVSPANTIVQTIPQNKSLYEALIDGAEDGSYKYPNGQDINPDIRCTIRVPPEMHIRVTKEQYQLYVDMDSAFEICKICSANPKSVRLEPCGHLLCRKCMEHWFSSTATCPFCREAVLSHDNIVVDSFEPDSDDELECLLPSDRPQGASPVERLPDRLYPGHGSAPMLAVGTPNTGATPISSPLSKRDRGLLCPSPSVHRSPAASPLTVRAVAPAAPEPQEIHSLVLFPRHGDRGLDRGADRGADRTDRSDRSDRADRADRVDRADRTDRADRADRVERAPTPGDRRGDRSGTPSDRRAERSATPVDRDSLAPSPAPMRAMSPLPMMPRSPRGSGDKQTLCTTAGGPVTAARLIRDLGLPTSEVEKALRVARFDQEMALDILLTYVIPTRHPRASDEL